VAEGQLDVGRALHLAGRLREAEAIYRRVLHSEPGNVQALHLLWAALSQQGDFPAALEAITAAVRYRPSDAALWHSLGTALTNVGRMNEAEGAYRQALGHRPDFAEAHFSLGHLLERNERLAEAEPSLRQAVRLAPDDHVAHNHLGMVLVGLGRPEQAATTLRRALAINPKSAHAYSNLGSALRALGQLKEAADSYRHALQLDSTLAAAHIGLGDALGDLGSLEEATKSYWEAIRLEPRHPIAHAGLALALMRVGSLAEAESAYRRALELKPNFSGVHSDLILLSNYRPDRTARDIYAEHRRFGDLFRGSRNEALCANNRDPDRPLRVGYVSGDFRDHSVAFFIEPVLATHDRRTFEITCYHNSHRSDSTTERLKAHAQRWRSIMGLPDDGLARLIREDAIDILVDLSGHTANNRLPAFARKPAPVQATWLGYPNTTGLDAMDWRITDGLASPEGALDSLHSEKLQRLPDSQWCYLPPKDSPDVVSPPGTRDGSCTFGAFCTPAKINDVVLTAWGEILRRSPGSRLIVLASGLPAVPTGYRRRFEACGIDERRLELHPQRAFRDYLALHGSIDVMLDTFPYSGGTTTCHALWMGVPVVSLTGDTATSRGGASLLGTLGLPELVHESRDRYVAAAAKLASDKGRLTALRASLRERMLASPLTDAHRFTRHLEGAYRSMWHAWCDAPRAG